jgi:hypothetical protein
MTTAPAVDGDSPTAPAADSDSPISPTADSHSLTWPLATAPAADGDLPISSTAGATRRSRRPDDGDPSRATDRLQIVRMRTPPDDAPSVSLDLPIVPAKRNDRSDRADRATVGSAPRRNWQ